MVRFGLVLVGLALAFGVMLLFGGTEFDRGLLMLLHDEREGMASAIASWVVQLGSLPVLLALFVAGVTALLLRRLWREAILLIACAAGGVLSVRLVEMATASLRPGPTERLLEQQDGLFPAPGAAYAAVVLLAIAVTLTQRFPARAIALWIAALGALSTGAAAVVLGTSWPSDVIGGWAFALLWTLLLLRLAGEELDEGTPAPLRHSPGQGGRNGKSPHPNRPRH